MAMQHTSRGERVCPTPGTRERRGRCARAAALTDAPRHQHRVRPRPGDCLMSDPFRTRHARTAFAGARWVRGVCFDG